jgi:probable phosphoglycerate mutase
VLIRDGIREIPAGELEMREDRESGELYMKVAFEWAQGNLTETVPGGPDGASVLGAFDAVVAELVSLVPHPDATAVIISHGAIVRTWLAARAVNVSVAFAAAHPLSNTGIIAAVGHPDTGWYVQDWEGEPVLGPDADLLDDPAGRSRPAR